MKLGMFSFLAHFRIVDVGIPVESLASLTVSQSPPPTSSLRLELDLGS
jgi:hypothetical protein